MIRLACDNNQLNSLDVTTNTALMYLACYDNQLTSLDISQNIALTELRCFNNQLILLNVKNGNNINFTYFNTVGNLELTCIEVDDELYSTANWKHIDTTAEFSENCNSLSVNDTEITKSKIAVYPNPTSDQINFSVQSNVQVMNITGQIIVNRKNINTLNLSDQPAGIYFLIFTDDNEQVVQRSKIVKK